MILGIIALYSVYLNGKVASSEYIPKPDSNRHIGTSQEDISLKDSTNKIKSPTDTRLVAKIDSKQVATKTSTPSITSVIEKQTKKIAPSSSAATTARPKLEASSAVDLTTTNSYNGKDKMYELGHSYATGAVNNDGKINYNKALECYLRAAELGSVKGMYMAGYYYDQRIEPHDYKKVMYWYTKAAEAGDAKAMSNIGYMYSNGTGTDVDNCKALSWFIKAAQAGNVRGMFQVGKFYKRGDCPNTKDDNLARQWLHKAIEAGRKPGADDDSKEAAKWAQSELTALLMGL